MREEAEPDDAGIVLAPIVEARILVKSDDRAGEQAEARFLEIFSFVIT